MNELEKIEVGLGTRKGQEGYDQSYGRIQSVQYSHDAMIDEIIKNPQVHQGRLAQIFGYSVPWVSRIIGSDAFAARLEERKGELVDPVLVQSIEERLRGMVMQSIDVLQEKLALNPNGELAVKALEVGAKALGYGARQANVAIQQNFVVAVPTKSESAAKWAEEFDPTRAVRQAVPIVIENPVLQGLIERERQEGVQERVRELLDGDADKQQELGL